MQVLWITAALLSSPLLTLCDPLYIMSAPNNLRVGSLENVFVEAQDYTGGGDIFVRVVVMNHPRKSIQLNSEVVVLKSTNMYQALAAIKIPENNDIFGEDPSEKQYVYLQAHFPTTMLEKVVMVSFQSGYIFVQTDKSIYTPGTTVQYRVFSLTPDLQPRDQTGISVEVINPQGISIYSDLIFPKQGVLTGKYDIPEPASSGEWTIATWFKSSPQKNFTAEFEVKEYVLPTFEVTLGLSKPFFYVDDKSLQVKISAKYLFGKNVNGNAFVVFGVMQGESKTSLPASLKKVSVNKGVGNAQLTKEMIQKTFPDVTQLVGSSLYITVSVLTETGSEMVEAQKTGIQIVTSPYTIHFKRTPKYFKPGMPFDVAVYVTNPDQTPANDVDVMINEQPGRTQENGMAKVKVNTQERTSTLKITARTKDPEISQSRQDEKTMTAQAYATQGGSNNYLHISIDASELKVGEIMKATLKFDKSPGVQDQDFTYLILSKGQIVQANRFKRERNSEGALSIPITKEMLPSFRVVAYYHVGASEVVADSVWVDVKDTCMGTLKVQPEDIKVAYQPGEKFNLNITGDSGAKVGLVAVDKAIFLLNKNRLTQSKIWDIIEKHDTGCTAGSGKDSMGVFYDAGLLFQSDKAGGTPSRTTPDCSSSPKRRRRATTIVQVIQTLTGKYTGSIKKCCSDGLRQNKLGYTCERRATFITDGAECVQAFLHCCKEMQTLKKESADEEMHLARSEETDFDDYDDFVSRTQFPESWLWEDKTLPTCQGQRCTSSILLENNYMKDSITTWQILAISLSKTHGICVADPYEMIVRKDFFVDLKMPYAAVRNEQLEIKAILHNYSGKKQTVRVEFLETPRVCSAASKKNHYRTTVTIEDGSTKSVPFIIIPMDLDNFWIEVRAISRDGLTDGVRKELKVVSEGVLSTVEVKNVELNPSQIQGGVQVINVRSDVPGGQIPKTPAHTYISVSGEEISQTIEQAINGDFMGRLIVQPYGCGEQTMIRMTLPLIATHYLDITKQWEGVGMDRRREAINHIRTGYNRELTFRKTDGSYSAWSGRPSSTWLTAYVTKVFAMASDLISIRDDVLCDALKWLILKTQMPDGMFKESAPVILGEMVGDVRGKDADASLTAFILIAMQEASDLCAKSVTSLPESMRKALQYLEGRTPSLTNPYAVAMISYAMANAGKFNKDLLMKYSSGGGAYWQVSGGHHFSLEATAYALLALVKVKDMDAAGKAVNWLNRQGDHYGSYHTTQATIMVFQAVAEYYKEAKKSEKDFNLEVELSVSGRSKKDRWIFRKQTSHLTRSDKVKLKQEFKVTAKGTGVGSLKVMTVYYARPVQKESDCTAFDLTVKLQRQRFATYPGASQSYVLTIDIQYKSQATDATMTILDISLLTGFVEDKTDLSDLSTGSDRYIQKSELNKQLSERGSLILYLDKVSRSPNSDRIAFKVHKITEVAMLQPAAVTVYEYYSPEKRCTKFYHPEKKDGALSRLCEKHEDLCECAEENCSVQKKEKIGEKERLKKACEAGMDYVYKVKIVSSDLSPNADYYTMMVEQVLKEGSDQNVEGKERQFLGHPNCRESFGFEEGKSYLVMGHSDDLPKIQDQLLYILGEQTWIEYWPTGEEGQTPKYKEQYVGIAGLKNFLDSSGCTT